MQFLPRARSWRIGFLIVLAIFFVTRLWTLLALPIFNDEAIYLQYSQAIHENWTENKFVSMHNRFHDWKPPLQYWLAAPVIRWSGDPLRAGRSVALAASLCGLVGFYLFARKLFEEREGVVCAGLYSLCPPVLFHNNQFTAETFLFSTAPFVYWAVLHALEPKRSRWLWALAAILGGAMLLLFKQSGFLLLAVSIFLVGVCRGSEGAESGKSISQRINWKTLASNLILLGVIIGASQLIAHLILPSAFDATKERFNGQWVMSASEVLNFPGEIWRANLSLVSDYIGAWYSWSVPVFLCFILWWGLRKRSSPELVLLLMFLAGGGGVIFLLRAFNEYLFNTAVIVSLLPLLARSWILAWPAARTAPGRLLRVGLLVFAALTLANWTWQIALLGSSPGRFIEQSTPWAAANYLKAWPTGFGINDVVRILEQEKRPGLVFADPQWGNPRTALEVYGREKFLNLHVISAAEFPDGAEMKRFADSAREKFPARFLIFSADQSGRRQEWQRALVGEVCQDRIEVKSYPTQMPLILCRF
ncbi:MAG: glycosyltransferase family 39 protein [Chthoniobacterales bacterium]